MEMESSIFNEMICDSYGDNLLTVKILDNKTL